MPAVRHGHWIAGLVSNEVVSLLPGIERRGIVMPAVAPQHNIPPRATRPLRSQGRSLGHGEKRRDANPPKQTGSHPPAVGAAGLLPPLAGEGFEATSGGA